MDKPVQVGAAARVLRRPGRQPIELNRECQDISAARASRQDADAADDADRSGVAAALPRLVDMQSRVKRQRIATVRCPLQAPPASHQPTDPMPREAGHGFFLLSSSHYHLSPKAAACGAMVAQRPPPGESLSSSALHTTQLAPAFGFDLGRGAEAPSVAAGPRRDDALLAE